MDALELYTKNREGAVAWYCNKCKNIAKSKSIAEDCCKLNNCKYCGKQVEEMYWTAHRECVENEQIRKAEKLDGWDGWVFYNDRYYSNVFELTEELECDANEDEKLPEYVYICKEVPFAKVDLGRILEHIEENGYDGISDRLSGLDALSKSIDEFNEDNKELISYEPDYSKMVKIKRKKN